MRRTGIKVLSTALALIMGITICCPLTGVAATGQKKESDMSKYLTAHVNKEALTKRDSDYAGKIRTQKGFQYVISKGKATIVGYTGTGTKLTVPKKLGKKPVSGIGIGAFAWNSNLKSVTLPDSVTTIEGSAFAGCENMTKITLGKKVKNIGDCAFYYTGLTSFTMPDSVTKLGREAFLSTFALRKITLSKNLKEIPDSAFENSALTSVKLPSGVTTLAYKAFYNCGSLATINVKNIKKVSGMALKETRWFSKQGDNVYVGTTFVGTNGNPEGVVIKKGTTKIADYACEGTKAYWDDSIGDVRRVYSRISKVVIPNTVKSIGEAAFYDNPIKKLTVPSSVTNIGPLAFGFMKFWQEDLEHDYYYFHDQALKELNVSEDAGYNEEVADLAWKYYNKYREEEFAKAGALEYANWDGTPTVVMRLEKSYGYCVHTEDFELHGKSGSAAEAFAIQNGLKFVAE